MSTELIELLAQALNHKFIESVTKPVLTISYTSEKGYTVSVVRLCMVDISEIIVYQSTNLDLVAALTAVAHQLVADVEDSINPVEQLSQKLQTSKPNRCNVSDSDLKVIKDFLRDKIESDNFFPFKT